MDLKIKDVAELLSISETTVRRLLLDRKIPFYRLNHQYRFSRCEIEDWLMQQSKSAFAQEGTQWAKMAVDEEESKQCNNMQYSLYRALYRGEVQNELVATEKERLIGEAMECVAVRFELDGAVLTDLFLDRERMMPTAIGYGVAVPHTRDFLLNTHYDVIEVVYPQMPIAYGALDGEAVHTLFFLFACDDRHHLNLLAKLAHLCSNPEARCFFKTRPDKKALLSFVKEWESSLNN